MLRTCEQVSHLPLSILEKWPASVAPAMVRSKVVPPSPPFPIEPHLTEALGWVLSARQHSRDGGIPAYFDLLRGRWRNSYPETTGYMIPTLLACADRLERSDLA